MSIRIVVKKPGIVHKPEVREVEGTLADYQGIVEGLIQSVYIPELHEQGIDLWVNEEGKCYGLPANFMIFDGQDCVVGTAFFASFNDLGDIVSLSDAQVETVRKFLSTTPIAIFG